MALGIYKKNPIYPIFYVTRGGTIGLQSSSSVDHEAQDVCCSGRLLIRPNRSMLLLDIASIQRMLTSAKLRSLLLSK